MNRKELLERALNETGSMIQALELVKEWTSFADGELREESTFSMDNAWDKHFPMNKVVAKIPETFSIPEEDLFKQMEATMADEPNANQQVVNEALKEMNQDLLVRGRYSWKQHERELAAQLFDNGHGYDSVAWIMKRSRKAVMTAISRGIIVPKNDPRQMSKRAGAIKSAITRGRNLRDYDEADFVLKNTTRP